VFNRSKIVLAIFGSLGLFVVALALVTVDSSSINLAIFESLNIFIKTRCMHLMLFVMQRNEGNREYLSCATCPVRMTN